MGLLPSLFSVGHGDARIKDFLWRFDALCSCMTSVYRRVEWLRSLITQSSVAGTSPYSVSHAYYTQAPNLLRRPSPSYVQTGYGTTADCRLYPHTLSALSLLKSSSLDCAWPTNIRPTILINLPAPTRGHLDIFYGTACKPKSQYSPWRNLHLRHGHEKWCSVSNGIPISASLSTVHNNQTYINHGQ